MRSHGKTLLVFALLHFSSKAKFACYSRCFLTSRSYPKSEVRGGDERSYPASKVRGSGWEELPYAPMPGARGGGLEDQPHIQGAVAAQAQEGLEELSHVEGQE